MSKRIEGRVQELHVRFVNYGRNAREWMRKCVMLLPEIERERVWEKKGFGSVYEYAGKLAGMSRSCVDEALRVLKRIQDKPELILVAEERGINAVKPVATIATPDTAAFWAGKVETMSKNTLEVYVHEVRDQEKKCEINSEATQLLPRKELTMTLDPSLAAQLEKLCVASGGDWNVVMRKLLEARDAVLEHEQPEAVEATSRHIPAEIEKFVIKRSGGLCEFPKCTRAYAILHHTQRFALEEVHDPARLVALCVAHERLVHLGLIAYEDEAPNKWAVREEADPSEKKYAVDQKVQKFRRPG